MLQHTIILNSRLRLARWLLLRRTMKTLSDTMRKRLMMAESTISEMN
jgi:ABC-type multidrug transport system ATPase subunit